MAATGLLAALGTGCGNGAAAGNVDVANLAAVRAEVSQGGFVNRSQADCVSNRAEPKLSAQGIRLSQSSTDLSKLPAKDLDVIYASFDACVTTAQLGREIAALLGNGGASKLSTSCFQRELTKTYPTSGQLMREVVKGGTDKLSAAETACLPNGEIEKSLIQSMESGGYTKGQATCVADRVLSQVKLSDLTGSQSSTLPPDVQSKIVDATKLCSASS